MPGLPAFAIPEEAAAKLTQPATKDWYADLTDEERKEEGLPPREPAKAETPADTPTPETPEETPQPTPGKEPEPEGDEEEETTETDDAVDRLFEEIEGLRGDLTAALGPKQEPPRTEQERDELMEAALDHDDPVVRVLAQRLQAAEAREAKRVEAERAEYVDRLEAEVDAEINAAKAVLVIDGKPMDEKQVARVALYMKENPEYGRVATFEEAARRVFPNVEKVAKPSPARSPDGKFAPGKQPAVATVVTEGSPGVGSSEPFKPRPNETIESAVEAFGRAQGWKR